jgi:ABC-type dipeptide/oligopeptide/nickel transport system ATPase subunit
MQWYADDIKFKHPFTCIISGPTGSGKSSFCVRFLQNLDGLCTELNFDGEIVCCYSEKSAVPTDQLARLGKSVRIHEGLPTSISNPQGRPSLIIFDDLLNEVYSTQVCDLFTKGSHHRNISVILISQNLFNEAKHCRDICLNAKYLVLLKNVRDKNYFAHLERQVHPQNSASLYDTFLEATEKPHGT